MYSRPLRILLCITVTVMPLTGCRSIHDNSTSTSPATTFNEPSSGPSYLEPYEPVICENDTTPPDSISPDQVLDYANIKYVPIALEDCIQRALADSEVFRELGGTVVTTPIGMRTALDPALIYSNPTFGEEAALSVFDAEYSQSILFEKNDRPFNNPFTGDSNGFFQQDFGEFNFQLTKLAATGTRFTSRGIINYDDNSQAGNRFFHTWETIIDNEFRHPLLQGSGTFFNRIAGPSQVPGSFNGVLIARTNTEIGLAEFQTAVRDFVVNIENAYWDLYYAYRELNAQTDARDGAFEVYKLAEAEVKEQRISTLETASAYEQYLRFEVAINDSLEGRPSEATQTTRGISGGILRRNVGVRLAERRLRYLIGMPITDGVLLQPSDKPDTSPVVFDWEESVESAMSNRPETRRQRWLVKQRELQLIASKNFLLPRLDFVGRYRVRGLGRDLTGGESWQDVVDSGNNNNGVSGAFTDLGTFNFQEWQLGLELRTPIGFRQAHAGVRNAELATERARMILDEQERKIMLDLSNAIGEVRRSSTAMSVASQRYDAATEYRSLAAERVKLGRAQIDVLLEAQRRVLESQIQFINAEVENRVALRNVHYERGSLLQFHGVALSENMSEPGAYIDASRRQSRRKRTLNYILQNPSIAQPLNDNGPVIIPENVASAEEASPGAVSVVEETSIAESTIENEEADQPIFVEDSPYVADGEASAPDTQPEIQLTDTVEKSDSSASSTTSGILSPLSDLDSVALSPLESGEPVTSKPVTQKLVDLAESEEGQSGDRLSQPEETVPKNNAMSPINFADTLPTAKAVQPGVEFKFQSQPAVQLQPLTDSLRPLRPIARQSSVVLPPQADRRQVEKRMELNQWEGAVIPSSRPSAAKITNSNWMGANVPSRSTESVTPNRWGGALLPIPAAKDTEKPNSVTGGVVMPQNDRTSREQISTDWIGATHANEQTDGQTRFRVFEPLGGRVAERIQDSGTR